MKSDANWAKRHSLLIHFGVSAGGTGISGSPVLLLEQIHGRKRKWGRTIQRRAVVEVNGSSGNGAHSFLLS